MSDPIQPQPEQGPREDGRWCCACGVHYREEIGMETCPASAVRMHALGGKGLTHLWANGTFERALKIWNDDAYIRARLALA